MADGTAVEIPPASLAMKRLWLGNSAEAICSATVAQMLATNLFFPPDPDDSWQMDSSLTVSSRQGKDLAQESTRRVADAGGGYKMIWENPGPIVENFDASLRFKLGPKPATYRSRRTSASSPGRSSRRSWSTRLNERST